MKTIQSQYEKVVLRIATPYATGTGFYLREHNLIVTSEFVVRDNPEVIVEASGVDRQIVPVVFTDAFFDLALLQPVLPLDLPEVKLAEPSNLTVGDAVLAIGHPFGFPFMAVEGTIKNLTYRWEEQDFIEIDASLPTGNGGGPVVNMQGEVEGVNTFLVRKTDRIDYALPVAQVSNLLMAYEAAGRKPGLRCEHCEQRTFAMEDGQSDCSHCGKDQSYPHQLPVYHPEGISQTIEELINEVGHPAPLTRRGPNTWELKQGSARVNISYYEKNGLIIGDAYLCELPPDNEKPLLEYLLKQNHDIEGLTFSIRENAVVLSLLIYDRYFNQDTGFKLFRHLLEKADYHDNILVELFGASWRKAEDE